MNAADHEPIVTIAYLAATADGQTTPEEQSQLRAALGRLGITKLETKGVLAESARPRLRDVVGRLTDQDARFLAYETALVVCHADGPVNDRETGFLAELRDALGLDAAATGRLEQEAATLAGAGGPTAVSGREPPAGDVDQMILRQAMITAAVELLPDKLANVVILPIQLRMVHQIGQRHGQKLDANQIKDLAGTLGLGAAARVMEGVVRKFVGGVTGGLFGGLVGGAGGLAVGAAVTFASTYALGHAANQYYAQGRQLGGADLRALFKRFQEDAREIFPKMQDEIQAQAKRLNLQNLLKEIG